MRHRTARANDDGAPPHDPRVPLRHAARADVEGAQKVEKRPGEGKISGTEARSRRPAVLWRLHAVDATRVHLTMKWVVSFSILRPFGPFPVNTMLRAGSSEKAVGLRHGRRLVGFRCVLLRTVNRSAGVVYL